MQTESMLTTIDNPFDPFTQFDEWYQFDVVKGYNTCAYLARVAIVSDSLSEADYAEEAERAMDLIVLLDPTCVYRKVQKAVEVKEFTKKK